MLGSDVNSRYVPPFYRFSNGGVVSDKVTVITSQVPVPALGSLIVMLWRHEIT